MPNRVQVQCTEILVDDTKTDICQSGDSVKVRDSLCDTVMRHRFDTKRTLQLRLKGVEEDGLLPGYVLCQDGFPCSVCT